MKLFGMEFGGKKNELPKAPPFTEQGLKDEEAARSEQFAKVAGRVVEHYDAGADAGIFPPVTPPEGTTIPTLNRGENTAGVFDAKDKALGQRRFDGPSKEASLREEAAQRLRVKKTDE